MCFLDFIWGYGAKEKTMTSPNPMGICRNSPDLLDNLSGAHSNHSGLREMIIHNPTEHGQATDVSVLTSGYELLFKDNGNGVPLCSTNPQEKCAKNMFNFGTQGMRMTGNNISRVGLGIFQSMIGNQGGLGRNAICISVWKSPNGHRECFVGFLARSFMDSIQTVSVPCVSFTFQATGEWTTHSSDICKLDMLKQTAEPELFSYLEGKKLSEAIKTQFPTTDDTGICWIVPKVYDTYNLSIEGDIINNGASLREVLRQALLPTKLPNFSMSIDGVQIDRTKHIAIQMERYPCYHQQTHKSRDGQREMRISRCFTPKNSDLRVNGGRILVYHHGHFVCEKKGKKWGLEEEGHASQALIVVNQQFLTPNVVKNDFQDLDHMKDEQKWFNKNVRTHYKEIKKFGRLQRLAESSSDSDGSTTPAPAAPAAAAAPAAPAAPAPKERLKNSKKRAATSVISAHAPPKKKRTGTTVAVVSEHDSLNVPPSDGSTHTFQGSDPQDSGSGSTTTEAPPSTKKAKCTDNREPSFKSNVKDEYKRMMKTCRCTFTGLGKVEAAHIVSVNAPKDFDGTNEQWKEKKMGELRKLGFPTLNLNSPENGLLLTHDLHAAYDYTLHSNHKVRISFDKNYKLTNTQSFFNTDDAFGLWWKTHPESLTIPSELLTEGRKAFLKIAYDKPW